MADEAMAATAIIKVKITSIEKMTAEIKRKSLLTWMQYLLEHPPVSLQFLAAPTFPVKFYHLLPFCIVSGIQLAVFLTWLCGRLCTVGSFVLESKLYSKHGS